MEKLAALILYDSFFGNTEKIAKAIAEGASDRYKVTLIKANREKPVNWRSFRLIVVGSPTRGFRPSPETITVLDQIPAGGLKDIKVTAFDTRIDLETIEKKSLRFLVKTGGYADKPIYKKLLRKGGTPAGPPEGFLVTGQKGPLGKHEEKRAREWGARM